MDIVTLIRSADSSALLFINHEMANRFFDILFPLLRDLTYVFWVFMIIFFWMRKERKLAVLLAAGLAAGYLLTSSMKVHIDRARPYDALNSVRLMTEVEHNGSFPSGHTEMSFLASTLISRFKPNLGLPLYCFSAIVGLSRIYVGVHYPLDVIGGAISGYVFGLITLKIYDFLETKKQYLQNNIS